MQKGRITLLKGHQINITYKAISKETPPRSYSVHPLGLAINEDAIYLLCTIKDRREISTLMMQRVLAAEATTNPIHIPIEFDIDKVAASSFQIKLKTTPIKLKLKMRKSESKRLDEAPISSDQKISSPNNDWSVIEATVDDSVHMRRWLQSLGSNVVVLEPTELREKIFCEIQTLQSLYQVSDTI